MMINIQEAKTHLSRHVEAAAAGAEIVIAKNGKPMAKLVPYHPVRAPRTLGRFAGQLPPESADCWEPDGDLEEAMSGSPLYQPKRPSRVAEEPGS